MTHKKGLLEDDDDDDEEDKGVVIVPTTTTTTTVMQNILWLQDSTGKTPIQLLHATHTESPHPQEIRDLTAYMVYIMLEYPSFTKDDDQDGCTIVTNHNRQQHHHHQQQQQQQKKRLLSPPPWYDYKNDKHPYLLHNCLRLGNACPIDYVYEQLIRLSYPISYNMKLIRDLESMNTFYLDVDSWGESPLLLFLQLIPNIIKQWEKSKILQMWKDMLYISSSNKNNTVDSCHLPLLTHLLSLSSGHHTTDTHNFPLYINMCRALLQSYPRCIFDENTIPRSVYPYLIRIMVMDKDRIPLLGKTEYNNKYFDEERHVFESLINLPELFLG